MGGDRSGDAGADEGPVSGGAGSDAGAGPSGAAASAAAGGTGGTDKEPTYFSSANVEKECELRDIRYRLNKHTLGDGPLLTKVALRRTGWKGKGKPLQEESLLSALVHITAARGLPAVAVTKKPTHLAAMRLVLTALEAPAPAPTEEREGVGGGGGISCSSSSVAGEGPVYSL